MKSKRKIIRDPLLTRLEREIMDMLKREDLTIPDRLKAVDSGTRLLMIRHKVTDGGPAEGEFFADK